MKYATSFHTSKGPSGSKQWPVTSLTRVGLKTQLMSVASNKLHPTLHTTVHVELFAERQSRPDNIALHLYLRNAPFMYKYIGAIGRRVPLSFLGTKRS